MKDTRTEYNPVRKVSKADDQINRLNEISLLNLQIQMLEQHLNTAIALKDRLESEF